jgi:carboxymethylenebutenolidase
MAQTVTVDSAGNAMQLYESAPDGAARGAVVVIQEAFGLTEHIEDVCGRLSAAGYHAVAPHLFHRTGDPVIAYDDMQAVMPHLGGLSADGLAADIDASLSYLRDAGFTDQQVGIVGFCMGGSVVVFAAAHHALGAAVTFYGGGVNAGRFGIPPLAELAPTLKTPWLGLFGDNDQSIPTDQVETLRAAAKNAAVATEVVRYPDAGHGFHCDARDDSYHEPSAKDAWQRALGWFDAHLAKP